VILRGPEKFQYPSRKEFQHLSEIMHQVPSVQHRDYLPSLHFNISSFPPLHLTRPDPQCDLDYGPCVGQARTL
jgi:hypothetical protein